MCDGFCGHGLCGGAGFRVCIFRWLKMVLLWWLLGSMVGLRACELSFLGCGMVRGEGSISVVDFFARCLNVEGLGWGAAAGGFMC